MLCQANGLHKDQFKEVEVRDVKNLNTKFWLDLLIGVTQENQSVSKSNWPKCYEVELVKRKDYCPITRRSKIELKQFGELLAETNWVDTYPIILFQLSKIKYSRFPAKIRINVLEEGPIENLSLRTRGELTGLFKAFERDKISHAWLIRALRTSLKNEFIQTVTNAYFNEVQLPSEFRRAW